MKRNTAVIHAKQYLDQGTGSHISPIFQTTTFVLPDFVGNVMDDDDLDAVAGGISVALPVSACGAAVQILPCPADACGAQLGK